MKVDRYTKVVLTVIAGALSALAINYIIAPQPAVATAPAQGEGRYQVAAFLDSQGRDRVVVMDTRSGTLYNARSVVRGGRDDDYHNWTLDTRTGYHQ